MQRIVQRCAMAQHRTTRRNTAHPRGAACVRAEAVAAQLPRARDAVGGAEVRPQRAWADPPHRRRTARAAGTRVAHGRLPSPWGPVYSRLGYPTLGPYPGLPWAALGLPGYCGARLPYADPTLGYPGLPGYSGAAISAHALHAKRYSGHGGCHGPTGACDRRLTAADVRLPIGSHARSADRA